MGAQAHVVGLGQGGHLAEAGKPRRDDVGLQVAQSARLQDGPHPVERALPFRPATGMRVCRATTASPRGSSSRSTGSSTQKRSWRSMRRQISIAVRVDPTEEVDHQPDPGPRPPGRGRLAHDVLQVAIEDVELDRVEPHVHAGGELLAQLLRWSPGWARRRKRAPSRGSRPGAASRAGRRPCPPGPRGRCPPPITPVAWTPASRVTRAILSHRRSVLRGSSPPAPGSGSLPGASRPGPR